MGRVLPPPTLISTMHASLHLPTTTTTTTTSSPCTEIPSHAGQFYVHHLPNIPLKHNIYSLTFPPTLNSTATCLPSPVVRLDRGMFMCLMRSSSPTKSQLQSAPADPKVASCSHDCLDKCCDMTPTLPCDDRERELMASFEISLGFDVRLPGGR